jgi:hypothetical protein
MAGATPTASTPSTLVGGGQGRGLPQQDQRHTKPSYHHREQPELQRGVVEDASPQRVRSLLKAE